MKFFGTASSNRCSAGGASRLPAQEAPALWLQFWGEAGIEATAQPRASDAGDLR